MDWHIDLTKLICRIKMAQYLPVPIVLCPSSSNRFLSWREATGFTIPLGLNGGLHCWTSNEMTYHFNKWGKQLQNKASIVCICLFSNFWPFGQLGGRRQWWLIWHLWQNVWHRQCNQFFQQLAPLGHWMKICSTFPFCLNRGCHDSAHLKLCGNIITTDLW